MEVYALKFGGFLKFTKIYIRMLSCYDEIELLNPEKVDTFTKKED